MGDCGKTATLIVGRRNWRLYFARVKMMNLMLCRVNSTFYVPVSSFSRAMSFR